MTTGTVGMNVEEAGRDGGACPGPTPPVPLVWASPIVGGAPQPVAAGVPFAAGALRGSEGLALLGPGGRELPVQASPLARWPDGSVKWLLVESLVGPGPDGGDGWSLVARAGGDPGPGPLRIAETPEGVIVDTGAATFRIGRRGRPLLRVQIEGAEVLDPGGARVSLVDLAGRRSSPRIDAVTPEARGPVRATVRVEGRFGGRARCRFVARLCFFAGTRLVRAGLTLHNPARADRPGGIWDLGDPASILFRDLSLELSLPRGGPRRIAWSAEPGHSPRVAAADRLEIYQDSSGGENWDSPNHVNAHGRVPVSFRGYRARSGDSEESGRRASPVVSLRCGPGRVTAAIPEFWQQFPKALEVEGGTLRARLFPARFGDPFELQGGEQKTHTMWLNFGGGEGDAEAIAALDWVHRPARLLATPARYADSGALPHLAPAPASPDRLEAELAAAAGGPSSLFARREIIDEYGWRNFGDVFADHEAAYYDGPPPLISHYNNQYDMIYGMAIQYLRTGDHRWFDLLDPLARHVIDIDIYHTTRDKATYNGGLFWHTNHYRTAGTCTHRAYSKLNRRPGERGYGGGPSGEHNYTTGLLHYYYLTGDPGARAAVLGLADWVIGMDDGRRNILGLIDEGPTGSACRTAERSYYGPGRGAGNSINALIDGWLLAGERPYLEKAEALIRRTIHPGDDIAARDLLATERRWSYTVHLSSLARYLDVKAEAGELGAMYAYARAALLAYAAWMLEHEVPYFDRPEQLEFPTETWAAQEFRKANVLRLAAAHADEPLRSRLLARGRELADRAWSDLMRFESRGAARAVAILLREATRDAYFRSHPVATAPRPAGAFEFGEPSPFIGQKERVAARLKSIPGLAGAVALLVSWPIRRVLRRGPAPEASDRGRLP